LDCWTLEDKTDRLSRNFGQYQSPTEEQRLHLRHAGILKYHIPEMSVIRTVAMQTHVSKEFTLLSRDSCTGTQTDPAQRDDQGAGSKTQLGNG